MVARKLCIGMVLAGLIGVMPAVARGDVRTGGAYVTFDFRVPARTADAVIFAGSRDRQRPILVCLKGSVAQTFKFLNPQGTWDSKLVGGKESDCHVELSGGLALGPSSSDVEGTVTMSLEK